MSCYSIQDPRSATVKFSSEGASQAIPCLYEEIQGKRLILEASTSLPACTAVTVEYNDALFLGEVVISAQINDVWKVEVEVEQILTGLQSLIALRSRLLCENVPQPLRMMPIGAVN